MDPARGLRAADVADRVARGEVNRVQAAPTRTVSQIVRANVFTRFNALLGAMLVLILFVGPLQDALFGVVLVANTLIGIVQELRAKRTLDRLTVLRLVASPLPGRALAVVHEPKEPVRGSHGGDATVGGCSTSSRGDARGVPRCLIGRWRATSGWRP